MYRAVLWKMGELKLMRESKNKGVTVVNVRIVKAVDEDRSGVLSEVKAERANVAGMET